MNSRCVLSGQTGDNLAFVCPCQSHSLMHSVISVQPNTMSNCLPCAQTFRKFTASPLPVCFYLQFQYIKTGLGWTYTVSQKRKTPNLWLYLCHFSTDFQNFFIRSRDMPGSNANKIIAVLSIYILWVPLNVYPATFKNVLPGPFLLSYSVFVFSFFLLFRLCSALD